jgi:hypothetical protein
LLLQKKDDHIEASDVEQLLGVIRCDLTRDVEEDFSCEIAESLIFETNEVEYLGDTWHGKDK